MVVGCDSGVVLILKFVAHFSFIYQILYYSLKIRTSHLLVSICRYDFPNTVFAVFFVTTVSKCLAGLYRPGPTTFFFYIGPSPLPALGINSSPTLENEKEGRDYSCPNCGEYYPGPGFNFTFVSRLCKL